MGLSTFNAERYSIMVNESDGCWKGELHMAVGRRFRSFAAVVTGLLLLSAFGIQAAGAQDKASVLPEARSSHQSSATASHEAPVQSGKQGGSLAPSVSSSATAPGYFVEFRSRYAVSYGHTYLVHGRVGQKITKKDVIGLGPATESPVPWMIGHIIPVASDTGAGDGDAEEYYVSARYRILLSKAEYAKLEPFMNKLRSSSVLWHAVLYNCNAFVGDVARYIGLEVPDTLLKPQEFINQMKALNKGRTRVSANAPLHGAVQ